MEKKDTEGTWNLLKYIIGFCILCLVVVLILLFTGTFDKKGRKTQANAQESTNPSATPTSPEDGLIGVVKKIDKEAGVFTILMTETGVEQLFAYDGTTSFTSRYDQPLTAVEIPCGEIVEITFDHTTNKLKTCDITQKAWEYKEIGKWEMDKTSKTIKIGTKTYQYNDQLYAFDSNGEMDTNRLSSKDQVTIKGIDGQAYSIIVTIGHGLVTLTGYEAFLDGTIEVGYDIITTITDNMVLALREGEYRVTVTKNGLTATKYIKLMTGEDYTLDFSEYKPEKVQTGKCYFDVTPSGADLYIDNVETDYSKPIELKYGEYEVRAECAGYQTYYAKLTVAEEKEVLTIDLASDTTTSTTATPTPSISVEDTDSSTPTPTPSPTASPTASPSATPTVNKTNKIHIYTPVGAYVYLNDTYKGTIPVSFDKVVGDDMRLTLMMTGKDSKTYNVTVKNDGYDVVWSFDQWWK